MQFREFGEKLIGSKIKVKILRRILSDETLTSERELAKLIGASPGAVNRTLKEFHECNLISPMRVGSATVWNLNKQSYAYSFISDFQNKIKEAPIEDLKNYLKSLFVRSDVKKLVLFGSVAESKEAFNSDIDLFFLVEDEAKQKSLFELSRNLNSFFIEKYGNSISANIFTPKDLQNPKNKKFLEMVSRGIILGDIV